MQLTARHKTACLKTGQLRQALSLISGKLLLERNILFVCVRCSLITTAIVLHLTNVYNIAWQQEDTPADTPADRKNGIITNLPKKRGFDWMQQITVCDGESVCQNRVGHGRVQPVHPWVGSGRIHCTKYL